MCSRNHAPARRLRDIKPGRAISTPAIAKGHPMYFGQTAGGYGLIWKGERDWLEGKKWTDMVCLGVEAREVAK